MEQVIETIIIDHWARSSARIVVEGPHPSRPMPVFEWEILSDTKRLILGEELFNILTKVYKQEFRIKNVDRIEGERMAELNKFLKPGELGANFEELQRRKADSEFESHIKDLPAEQQERLRKAWENRSN